MDSTQEQFDKAQYEKEMLQKPAVAFQTETSTYVFWLN
jgi:hypothetical protein